MDPDAGYTITLDYSGKSPGSSSTQAEREGSVSSHRKKESRTHKKCSGEGAEIGLYVY